VAVLASPAPNIRADWHGRPATGTATGTGTGTGTGKIADLTLAWPSSRRIHDHLRAKTAIKPTGPASPGPALAAPARRGRCGWGDERRQRWARGSPWDGASGRSGGMLEGSPPPV
jgi:hypothetical protein